MIDSPKHQKPDLLTALALIQPALDASNIDARCVGGVPTDALLDTDTTIDHATKTITVSDNFSIPPYRENGTLRDLDILCLDNHHLATDRLFRHASQLLLAGWSSGEAPELSVSAYEAAPRTQAWLQVTSQVTKQADTIMLSLADIQEPIDSAIFEQSWTLQYGNLAAKVLHPVLHTYNYRIRSLSGLRKKDFDKVTRLETRLKDNLPPEELIAFSPLLRLESRIAAEMSIRAALRYGQARKFTHAVARYAIGAADRSPAIVKLTQSTDANPLALIGRSLVRHSRPSFVSGSPLNSKLPGI